MAGLQRFSVCLSVCFFLCLSVCLSVCLSACPNLLLQMMIEESPFVCFSFQPPTASSKCSPTRQEQWRQVLYLQSSPVCFTAKAKTSTLTTMPRKAPRSFWRSLLHHHHHHHQHLQWWSRNEEEERRLNRTTVLQRLSHLRNPR